MYICMCVGIYYLILIWWVYSLRWHPSQLLPSYPLQTARPVVTQSNTKDTQARSQSTKQLYNSGTCERWSVHTCTCKNAFILKMLLPITKLLLLPLIVLTRRPACHTTNNKTATFAAFYIYQGGKFPSVSLHIRTGDNPNYHVESYKSLPQVTVPSVCGKIFLVKQYVYYQFILSSFVVFCPFLSV